MYTDNAMINKFLVWLVTFLMTTMVGAIAWFSRDQVIELRAVQLKQAETTVELKATNQNLNKTENKLEAVMDKQDRQHWQIINLESNLKMWAEHREQQLHNLKGTKHGQ